MRLRHRRWTILSIALTAVWLLYIAGLGQLSYFHGKSGHFIDVYPGETVSFPGAMPERCIQGAPKPTDAKTENARSKGHDCSDGRALAAEETHATRLPQRYRVHWISWLFWALAPVVSIWFLAYMVKICLRLAARRRRSSGQA